MGIRTPFISEIAPDTYAINEFGLATMYLLVGKERALLIDTGCGICDLKQTVRELTDKPMVTALTHGHFDHCGGMDCFDEVYANEKDYELIRSIKREEVQSYADQFGKAGGYGVYDYSPEDVRTITEFPKLLLLNEGDCFDLGFSSVTVTWEALKKFRSLSDRFDQNFNGHTGYMGMPNCFSQPKETADDLIHICELILKGEGTPELFDFLGYKFMAMKYGCAKLSYDPKKL